MHSTQCTAFPPGVFITRVVREVFGMQAALQQQAQEKKKKAPAVPRAAGGEKWWDPTLVEWPQNDFRCRPAPFTSLACEAATSHCDGSIRLTLTCSLSSPCWCKVASTPLPFMMRIAV